MTLGESSQLNLIKIVRILQGAGSISLTIKFATPTFTSNKRPNTKLFIVYNYWWLGPTFASLGVAVFWLFWIDKKTALVTDFSHISLLKFIFVFYWWYFTSFSPLNVSQLVNIKKIMFNWVVWSRFISNNFCINLTHRVPKRSYVGRFIIFKFNFWYI